MKRKLVNVSRRYQRALLTHLKRGRQAGLESARGLGSNQEARPEESQRLRLRPQQHNSFWRLRIPMRIPCS